MKVFVAESGKKGYTNAVDYHWCDDNDLLIFGQFQIYDRDTEVSMCGIQNRKFTTHIIVKEMDIDRDFYKELITESIETAMETSISEDGSYKVILNNDWGMSFNINNIVDELLEKANCFNSGQKVKCVGRDLYPIDI